MVISSASESPGRPRALSGLASIRVDGFDLGLVPGPSKANVFDRDIDRRRLIHGPVMFFPPAATVNWPSL